MESIEIKTSHNIVLEFEMASLWQRTFALIIDMAIIYFAALLLLVIFSFSQSAIIMVISPLFLCYHLFSELFNNGQSIGKKVLKIRVVSLDGQSVSTKNIIIRWAFRLIDIGASLGMLAILGIFSSDKNQRLGDVLANTTVINISSQTYRSLDSITRLNDLKYEVTYPGVVMYNDQDMVLVKKALGRFQAKENIDTYDFCKELVLRLKNDLNIQDQKVDLKKFLNTILNDYIMLTR